MQDAVEVEAVEPLTLKGKSQPVPAYRLISCAGRARQRTAARHAGGRADDELAALQAAFDEAVHDAPGAARDGDRRRRRRQVRAGARVHGRASRDAARASSWGAALPYGDGITFWPLREMVVSAAGIRQEDPPEMAREKCSRASATPTSPNALASAAGLRALAVPAARDLLGRAQVSAGALPPRRRSRDVRRHPLGGAGVPGPAENLLETIGDAPVLLLATARHELLESHADWGERERLAATACCSRWAMRPRRRSWPIFSVRAGCRAFCRASSTAAEGNPLYVEQMLSMLIDNGAVRQEGERWVSDRALDADIAVPPTIHALLEARLDRLERIERAAAEPAAVIGMEFPRPAVEALAPEALRNNVVDATGEAIAQALHPPRDFGGEGSAYRFHHHLVRDTVYNGLLKRARAKLHTEFVRWADKLNADNDRGQEFEAILGYHLEQAYRYLGELGPLDDAGITIGRDGSRRLATAGRRAFGVAT